MIVYTLEVDKLTNSSYEHEYQRLERLMLDEKSIPYEQGSIITNKRRSRSRRDSFRIKKNVNQGKKKAPSIKKKPAE